MDKASARGRTKSSRRIVLNVLSQLEQFPKCPEYHGDVRPRLLAVSSRKMMDTGLRDGESAPDRAGQNLGVDQRAGAPQFHALENLAFI